MPHSLVQTLRGVPDFSPLDERSLLAIVGESMNLFWRAGSLIFEPGMPGDALYIILSGEVVIRAESGEEVARLRAGDSFGEISLLLNTTHRRLANAVCDCELLVLPKEENDWLGQSEEELLVRHCAYWVSLRGLEPTTAKKTVRISIPRSNVFSTK